MKELPEEIAEFINSFYIFSKLNKKGYDKFNYIVALIYHNEEEKDERTVFVSSLCDEDKEMLLSLINKNSYDLVKKINNTNKILSYPKPKQIKDGYFGSFDQQLSAAKHDLDYFSKKYNFSYLCVFYSEETIKYLYKIKQDIIPEYHSNIDLFLMQLRGILFGTNMDELIEAAMNYEYDQDSEDDEDSSNDLNIPNQERPNFLDQDEDEFNNY